MLRKPRTALIGAGRMGAALLRGWGAVHSFEPAGSVLVVDPNLSERVEDMVKHNSARSSATTDKDMLAKLETLVLAIKPQKFEEIAQTLAPILPKKVLIISVIAGVSLQRIEHYFGPGPHVRAMPNTAAEVGKSISVICANKHVSTAHTQRVFELLEAVGQVEQLDDERLMDVVTAVSGSGLAYFFLLVEVLAAAGQAEGLPKDLAQKLAKETLVGSGALMDQLDQSPADLRSGVTSPGGTTAAALDVMMGNGAFAEMMRNAVSAATRRGGQLRNVS